jgi:hypothetical protein
MTEEQRLKDLREKGSKYAAAKSERVYLDHYRKSKLAMLTRDILADGKESHASAETKARCHEEYIDVLRGLRDATEVEEKLRWELKIAEAGIEIWKEKQYNRRAEMKLT